MPLKNIRSVRADADADAARGWWRGFKAPGTHIPGLITAGSFYQNGEWSFWDVSDRQGVIVVELSNERFVRLVVEVSDPADAVGRLQTQLKRHAA